MSTVSQETTRVFPMTTEPEETGTKPSGTDVISLVDLIAVLLKHRLKIILISVIGSLLILGYVYITKVIDPVISPLPDVYTARGYLLLNQQSGPDLGGNLGNLASLAGVNIPSGGTNYGQLAIELAKSNTILDAIAEEFNLIPTDSDTPKTDSRQSIIENMELTLDGATGMLTIAYSDIDPALSAAIVNRTIDLLEARFATIGSNRNITERRLLEQKLTEVSAEITRLTGQIKEFQTRYGVLNVNQLGTELVTTLAQARSQLILKEMEIATYSEFSRITDPRLTALRAERESILQLIRELEQGSGQLNIGDRPTQAELPDVAFKFGKLERDLQVQTEIYKILTQQHELAKLKSEGEGPIFQVLELAEIPEKKSGPSRGMLVIVASMGCFFLAVFMAFFAEYLRRLRKDDTEMDKIRAALRRD